MRAQEICFGLMAVFLATASGCSGGSVGETASDTAPKEPVRPSGPLPTLLASQAQFVEQGGRQVPGPAKLTLWATDGERWYSEVIEDPNSNVFHKAVFWRDGLLTIGAEHARLVHWTKEGDAWKPKVLWEKAWGGKFDRLRDLEIGDVTGDGKEDLVLATHDNGVVAVGQESAGAWTFTELDPSPDTFVHEIEIGDVDGDGKTEFYATPSARNRASGVSQPGGVVRYDYDGQSFVRTQVADWTESHAKEILVADVDKNGRSELYAVREAHTIAGAGTTSIKDPVQVIRLDKGESGWAETVVATIPDRQCRFLIASDIDSDGAVELIAAGWKTGLYRLEPGAEGHFETLLIDADSTGFEHATHVADLDSDGKPEIYVAADDQRSLRRYLWNGEKFDRLELGAIGKGEITWNLQSAVLP